MVTNAQPGDAQQSTDPVETLKRYFEHLFANSRDMMNLFSVTQGKIILFNAAAREATGYTPEELAHAPVSALYPPEEHAKLALAFERLVTTGYSSEKLRMFAKSGELRDIWTRSYVVEREPEVICLVHTVDITEENRKRERDLREAKLATLGQSSAVLAHELKNALQSMQYSLGTLRMQLELGDRERVASSLQRIERAVTHMDSVIASVERSTANPRGNAHISLESALQNVTLLLRGYLDAKSVELRTELEPSLPPVWCDATHLEQILVVLIKNAAQAMAGRPQRKLTVRAQVAGDGVLLELEDTGGGMPPEIQARAFEAFSTTKPAGLGMGLGLSTARELAAKSAIDITFRSEPGVGTTFSLRLRVSGDSARELSSAALAGRVLLVVGDEPSTLEQASTALRLAGARVLVATSAADGLRLLRLHAVEAIVCDDAMYPVRGRAFVADAHGFYHGPVCLLVDGAEQDAQALGADLVLGKPLSAGRLVTALAALVT